MFIKKNQSGFISRILDFFDKHNLKMKANFYVSLLFVFIIILFLEYKELKHDLKKYIIFTDFYKITESSYERYFKNL